VICPANVAGTYSLLVGLGPFFFPMTELMTALTITNRLAQYYNKSPIPWPLGYREMLWHVKVM
jgi:hypothetical protein